MKKIMTDYFSFTRKDRIAVLIILVIGSGFVAMPYFFGVRKKPQPVNEKLQQQIASLQESKGKQSFSNEKDGNSNWQKPSTSPTASTGTVFQFDPNTLDEEGWIKLGIREKTAKTIIKYRSKGGKFRTPEDLRKIWGLRKEDADRIIPYAIIASANNNTGYNNYPKSNPASTKPVLLDANTATAYELKALPGVGPSLPYKIVNYRDKLGGFLNMLQVKETYGMNDSIFAAILPFLHVQPTAIKKININAASDFELSGHPYIDRNLAKAITIYRTQHGGFKSVDELKKIVFVKEETFNKISPYLDVK
jgi:competence protein ComEA